MTRSSILLLACAVAASAGTAWAAIGPYAHGGTRVDADGDGVITRAEAAARPRLAARFDRLDRNRDGRIDAAERAEHRGRRHRHGGGLERIVALDANGDGRIALTEAAGSRLAVHFARLDTNRDGYLVRREFEAGMERMRRERARQHEQRWREKFAQADRTGDGRLSRAEAEEALPRAAKAFAFLDENRDGFLSPQEARFGHGRR